MTALTPRQSKALAGVLEVQIEQTAAKAPKWEPHMAVEEIDDLGALAELLGDDRLIRFVRDLRAEHQARISKESTMSQFSPKPGRVKRPVIASERPKPPPKPEPRESQ